MLFAHTAKSTIRFISSTLLVLLIIPGCATRPISNADAIDAPVERMLTSSLLTPFQGSGKVTIKRDSGMGGSACSSRVFVDAKPVADLRSSEKIVIYLQAGDHIFSAWPNGICGGGMSEVRATIRPDAELNFRIGYGSNGDYAISATAF